MWQDMFDLLVANAVQNGIIGNDISAAGAVNRGGYALTMRPEPGGLRIGRRRRGGDT
jgi:hypothetical protein